ncbi:hypothetical protein EAS62_39595 [Bradyrhizobium zhanjiangense]|uniref:Uncharacterized protein n=1 Tax=Bradyrhizobium zhanjiangense TaxID=1325107 RepID=A0ABY0D9G5_9BRAD|nr:hypothetical protein EAS62_39595 [Bradyrhizobium zhanjiangense]
MRRCAVIPAPLIREIRSELPGQITAQLTEAWASSADPARIRLIRTYDNKSAVARAPRLDPGSRP